MITESLSLKWLFGLLYPFNQWIQEAKSLRGKWASVPKTLKCVIHQSHHANPTLYFTQGETEAGREAVPCLRSPGDTTWCFPCFLQAFSREKRPREGEPLSQQHALAYLSVCQPRALWVRWIHPNPDHPPVQEIITQLAATFPGHPVELKDSRK